MAALQQQTCEVKVGGAWRDVSLAEAHSVYSFVPKRCPTCHGQVYVSGTYIAGSKVGLHHRRGHDGCPQLHKRFRGTASPHPQPMI